jgi:hypothetical protein
MHCPTCKQDTLTAWQGPITRMGVEIVAHGQRCSSCGEQLFDYEELGRQDALIADEIARRDVRAGTEGFPPRREPRRE